MKSLERNVSRGVLKQVSPYIYNELFNLAEGMECFQYGDTHKFNLWTRGMDMQVIEHEQLEPEYKCIYRMGTTKPVTTTVWVFIERDTMIMVLEEEI